MTHRSDRAPEARAPTWPEELRRRREELALSRAELGRSVGVTAQTIEHWEGGKTLPGPDSYRQLQRVLVPLSASPLAAAIRAGREAHGWTIEDMAVDLGVTRWTWMRWESGIRVPGSGAVRRIERKLGIDLHKAAGIARSEPSRPRSRKGAGRAQHRRPPPEDISGVRERTCLGRGCERRFLSRGPDNRLCPTCASHPHGLPNWFVERL